MPTPPSPKSIILQEERRRFIEQRLLRGPWLHVCALGGDVDDHLSLYCGLIPKSYEKKFFENEGWDFHVGDGAPAVWESFSGSRRTVGYDRFGGGPGIEPLVFYRSYHNNWPTYLELSQEFCLFLNLFLDPKSKAYLICNSNGDVEEVAHIKELNCRIKISFILRYLAAKQMHLGLFFDGIASTVETLDQLGLQEHEVNEKRNDLIYELAVRTDTFSMGERNAFSRLIGKGLIRCPSRLKEAPFAGRSRERFCDFIIGSNDKGEPVRHTCEPEKLANFFGKNPDAPNYLTPVHFTREVLQKYYDNPEKYSVGDAIVRCGALWSIRIDNDLPNRVIVWLGDLGRDLAEEERLHWQHHNIPPEGGISRTSYTRNIRGWFADPQMPDLVFKHLYPQVISNWEKQNGWPLFLPLCGEDEHIFLMLRVPLADNRAEFDGQVLSLTKVLIDSLNEQALVQGLPASAENEKGISKLARWFQYNKVTGFEAHIQFLRDLQDLRAGSAHRKGEKYKKSAAIFQIEGRDLRIVGKEIFDRAVDFMQFLNFIVAPPRK